MPFSLRLPPIQRRAGLNTRVLLIGFLSICWHSRHPVQAIPQPPQENDVFGTVNGCASGLVEVDDNQDGMIKKDEYLDFVNLLADFLCVPPRPIMDLEIQTVFFSIACLCREREGYSPDCCFGTRAAIWTEGAADAIVRTEDQDAYLRAACLLTESILGPQQCTLPPATLSPAAIVQIGALSPFVATGGLSTNEMWAIIIGAILLALLCCLLCCCALQKKDEEEEEEEVEELIVKKEDIEPGDVAMNQVKSLEPVDEEAQSLLPTESLNSAPPAVPIPIPVVLSGPGCREEEDDESDSENIGKKMGVTNDDDEDDDGNRKFGGQGLLPLDPDPDGVLLRHVDVEKEGPGEYDYPERELDEYKRPKDDDSVQEFDPYLPDGGVYDPKRGPRGTVTYNPKYERLNKPPPEPYDPRKFRQQLNLGEGEVWATLAAYEEERERSVDTTFEWIVQGALEVLAKANESGVLIKPKPF